MMERTISLSLRLARNSALNRLRARGVPSRLLLWRRRQLRLKVVAAAEGAKGGSRISGFGVTGPRPPCWARAMVAAADSMTAARMILRIVPPEPVVLMGGNISHLARQESPAAPGIFD